MKQVPFLRDPQVIFTCRQVIFTCKQQLWLKDNNLFFIVVTGLLFSFLSELPEMVPSLRK
jgi:hypothetical protein